MTSYSLFLPTTVIEVIVLQGFNAPEILPHIEWYIHISRCKLVREAILSSEEERLKSYTITYYGQGLKPFTLTVVINLTQAKVDCTHSNDDEKLQLNRGWLDGFLKLNSNLKVVSLQRIEYDRKHATKP